MTTNASTTSTSVIMARSETLWPQQRVGQVEQQAKRDEAGERVVEDHDTFSSEPFAGVGIADACGEEAEAKRQHDDVQHGMFLCDVKRDPKVRQSRLLGTEVPPGA